MLQTAGRAGTAPICIHSAGQGGRQISSRFLDNRTILLNAERSSLLVSPPEMDFEDRRKRSKKSKGAKRKTRAMLEAERRGPLTFASLLEEASTSGLHTCPVVRGAQYHSITDRSVSALYSEVNSLL